MTVSTNQPWWRTVTPSACVRSNIEQNVFNKIWKEVRYFWIFIFPLWWNPDLKWAWQWIRIHIHMKLQTDMWTINHKLFLIYMCTKDLRVDCFSLGFIDTWSDLILFELHMIFIAFIKKCFAGIFQGVENLCPLMWRYYELYRDGECFGYVYSKS